MPQSVYLTTGKTSKSQKKQSFATRRHSGLVFGTPYRGVDIVAVGERHLIDCRGEGRGNSNEQS